jgi:Tol biopolymer transport system component
MILSVALACSALERDTDLALMRSVERVRAVTGVLAPLVASTGLAVLLAAQAPRAEVAEPVRGPASVNVLAFSRADGTLAVAAEDGSAQRRVASARGGEVVSHNWSPDGRRLAFSRCRGRNCSQGSVYVVRSDGTGERQVVSRAGAAVWLRDGRHLLVGRTDQAGHWIVAVNHASRRRFTAPGLVAAPGSPRLSPNGRWLLHLTTPYGRLIPNPYAPHHARARNWLMVTDLVSGRSRRVSGQRGWYLIGTAPWARDGMSFTFTQRSFLQAPGGTIYIAGPTSSGARVVGYGAREAGAWSPDGARLAFNVGGDCRIRVVTIDASAAPRELPFTGCLPTWQPRSGT